MPRAENPFVMDLVPDLACKACVSVAPVRSYKRRRGKDRKLLRTAVGIWMTERDEAICGDLMGEGKGRMELRCYHN